MCPREDVDYQDLKMQELKSDLAEMKSELFNVCNDLKSANVDKVRPEVKSDYAGTCKNLQLQVQEVKSELAEVKSQLEVKLAEVNRSLEDKLDAVLTLLREKNIDK